ncbi:glycosyltransferase [Roseomonas sp. AR75]|uniref:glycosyltransferase n=1 Tax=Roseomonas sp. AR75 TaxID=2562311 RepID=UPI0010C1324E|nr:hypothetical protein [Roseomonas sp. AR75]
MPTILHRPRRLVWIVNHRTLLPAEVPIFRRLGYEVFIPKIIPPEHAYRSGVVTHDYDASLTLPEATLAVLNAHDFYGRSLSRRGWSPTIHQILNAHFDVVVTSMSNFITPLRETVRHFRGLVAMRVFGLQHPNTYARGLEHFGHAELLDEIGRRGESFVFAQGFDNLAEIEPPELARRAHTVTVPLPERIYAEAESWTGRGAEVIAYCPGIQQEGYYRELYDAIRRDFGDLPLRIFGRQTETIPDPAILPNLTDAALMALYAAAPVMVYPSTEPRHVHYAPIEAMIVGTPVLYRRGALCDVLAGGGGPAACADVAEMREKALRLMAGDQALTEAIRAAQPRIVAQFDTALAERQWAAMLGPAMREPLAERSVA